MCLIECWNDTLKLKYFENEAPLESQQSSRMNILLNLIQQKLLA